MFAYGGHTTFPTIQHDMKKPKYFARSMFIGYTIVTVFYVLVVIAGNAAYGNSLRDSVINSLQTPWMQESVNVLIAVHCILATLIMINPVNQEAEEYFGVPQEFGLQRVGIRTAILFGIVLLAESVPTFGPIVNLLGASTFTLTSMILPSLFYVYLVAREEKIAETGADDGPVSFPE